MANEYAVNLEDMTAVADAIRTKGGTTAKLAFPTGFVNAVNGISTGVTVRETGTFSTEDGYPLIKLSFTPDLFIVYADGYTDDDGDHYESILNFYFSQNFDWVSGTAEQMCWSDKYFAIDAMAYRASNGDFGLSIWSCSESWEYVEIQNETYSYEAIKFT